MSEYSSDLCKFRLEQATRCVESAELLFDEGDYNGADFKHHSGVISYFRREYIKTGKFDKVTSEWIAELFDLRSFSDYQDFYLISKQAVKIQVERASQFCMMVKNYLQEKKILED